MRRIALIVLLGSVGCAAAGPHTPESDPAVSFDEVAMPKVPAVERDPATHAGITVTEGLRPELEGCLAGTQASTFVMLHYDVSASGAVEGMTIEQQPEEDPTLSLCFAEVMARADFPPFGEPKRVSVPFEFYPNVLHPAPDRG